MSPIGVVIVDDDPLWRKIISANVTAHKSLKLLGTATCLKEGFDLIHEKKPDVVFLDIYLSGAMGFSLLKKLKNPPHVVFVTSSLSHSLEAFDLEAVDYLVKPFRAERFASTVRRLEKAFYQHNAPAQRHEKDDRIPLKTDGKLRFVSMSRIAALQANGNFTRISCVGEPPLLIGQLLGAYDDILPSPPFLRLDRSLIINLDQISLVNRVSRDLSIMTLNGVSESLKLGRTATERLKEGLQEKSGT